MWLTDWPGVTKLSLGSEDEAGTGETVIIDSVAGLETPLVTVGSLDERAAAAILSLGPMDEVGNGNMVTVDFEE